MQKEKKEKEEQETSVVKEISLFTLGKRKREGSGLDNDAKERLRNKIQELREKRNAPEKKKQKVERNSEEETEKRLADNVKNSISESMISADGGEEMEVGYLVILYYNFNFIWNIVIYIIFDEGSKFWNF